MPHHSHHPKLNRLVLLLGMAALLPACKSTKRSDSSSDNSTPAPTPTPTPFRGGLDIRETNIAGATLAVSLKNTSNWQFIASYASGVEGQIVSIKVTSGETPASMNISGNRITFTPTRNEELTGSFIVTARGPGSPEDETKSFYWSGKSGIFGGILKKVFPNATNAQTLSLIAGNQDYAGPLDKTLAVNHCEAPDIEAFLASDQNVRPWANSDALIADLTSSMEADLNERDELENPAFAERKNSGSYKSTLLKNVMGAYLCSPLTQGVLRDCYPTTFQAVSSGILVKKAFNRAACAAAQ
jgi:hypothetical protein